MRNEIPTPNKVASLTQTNAAALASLLAEEKWQTVNSPSDVMNVVSRLPLTDMKAAEFLYSVLGEYVHYNASSGWYEWDGTIHALDSTSTMGTAITMMYAKALDVVLETMRERVMDFSGPDAESTEKRRENGLKALTPLQNYSNRIQNSSGMGGLTSVLTSVFRVDNNYFDRDKAWAVMEDGRVIDLGRSASPLGLTLLEPDPARPVTRRLGVSVDEDASGEPSWFLSLLRETVSNEEEVAYLQEAAGAALLGEGKAKNIPHLVGPPHTFKSVYLNVLAHIFGDYAGTLPAGALVQKYGGGANFAQSRARGIRFLYLSEPQTTRTDDAFLKNLSGGGEPINTEQKGKDSVAWYAQCVLHIAANHVVRFDTKDSAIVSRMNIVEFHNQVPEDQINPNLTTDLINAEGSLILLWILEGARRYAERGSIRIPQSVKDRAKSHVVESSAPLRWLEDLKDSGEVVVSVDAAGSKMWNEKDAWESFTQWSFENLEGSKITRSAWRTEIMNALGAPRGFEKTRPGGYKRLFGVVQKSEYDALTERTPEQKVHKGSGTTWASLTQ